MSVDRLPDERTVVILGSPDELRIGKYGFRVGNAYFSWPQAEPIDWNDVTHLMVVPSFTQPIPSQSEKK